MILATAIGFFVFNSYVYKEKQEASGPETSESNETTELDDDLWQEDEEPVFCTMDVMMCPDGSYVGRQAPNCEFAACPGSAASNPSPTPAPSEPVACTMDAKICPDGSAVGRQGPKCEFAPCPGE